MTGLLSVRLSVSEAGVVEELEVLVDLLVVDPEQLQDRPAAEATQARSEVVQTLLRELADSKFEACAAPTQITYPFIFD